MIDASKKITVKLPDGRSFTAKLVGTDPATDVALLKINSEKPLPTVEFGDDKKLRVGDWVVAVGNPFGLSNSVTAGIVSSLGRDIEASQQYTNFIQIDAPINRGNSGGPTFDLRGQVIGMNSMIFSPSGGSVGIGFAIPASLIHDVVAQLKTHGHVTRGYLGVNIQSVTPEIASSLGLKDTKGAIVADVVPGGPAAKAGHRAGRHRHRHRRPGGRRQSRPDPQGGRGAGRRSRRSSSSAAAASRCSSRPPSATARTRRSPPTRPAAGGAAAAPAPMRPGLAPVVADAGSASRTYGVADGVNSGAVITKVDPDSDAADKGLQPGDVVLKIGSRAVRNPADFQTGVAEAKKGGRTSVLLLVAAQPGRHRLCRHRYRKDVMFRGRGPLWPAPVFFAMHLSGE